MNSCKRANINFSKKCSDSCLLFLSLYELAFWCSALWACPFVGQLLEGCFCRDSLCWVSDFWVVDVAATCAFPFVHLFALASRSVDVSCYLRTADKKVISSLFFWVFLRLSWRFSLFPSRLSLPLLFLSSRLFPRLRWFFSRLFPLLFLSFWRFLRLFSRLLSLPERSPPKKIILMRFRLG